MSILHLPPLSTEIKSVLFSYHFGALGKLGLKDNILRKSSIPIQQLCGTIIGPLNCVGFLC